MNKEDVEKFRELNPLISFIKVSQKVKEPNIELLKQYFIPDRDMPTFPDKIVEGTRIYPLAVTSFPGVLKGYTAMEAGVWAVHKCKAEHWETNLTNICCCLNNLEMDF